MAIASERFRRSERVVATKPLLHVPEGTAGKVVVEVGLTWPRYRVRFDNGVEVGSIDAKFLRREGANGE